MQNIIPRGLRLKLAFSIRRDEGREDGTKASERSARHECFDLRAFGGCMI